MVIVLLGEFPSIRVNTNLYGWQAAALITIKQSVREQLRLEAAWLQAQIQPHFLFNALNAVIALSSINLNKMRDLLEEFSNVLRSKFKFQHMDQLIPVKEELSLVRSYLYIEKVRFEERLEVIWEIDECGEVTFHVPNRLNGGDQAG